jgi:HlyD family secretion protein
LSLLAAGSRREDVAAAEAALRAAEAARRSAATDLGDAILSASVSGTVVTRAREPGAIVAPGETVYTLSIDRPLRLRAYVAETELRRISPGMAVEVSADGNPKVYRGTIGHISPRAEFTPKSVETEDLRTDLVYRLRILVRDPDDGLRQGQPVTIRIPAARPARRD